jgi:hypothetical protein
MRLSWSAESLNLLKNKCAVIGDDLEKLRHTVFSRHQSTVMVQLFLVANRRLPSATRALKQHPFTFDETFWHTRASAQHQSN